MKTRSDIAINYFNGGCNCAQAVLTALKDYTGLDIHTSQSITAGFGGGIGNANSICGAVSGTVMAIGMWHGKAHPDKSVTFYRERFLKEFGKFTPQYTCKGILKKRPSFINNQTRVCVGAVSKSVEIFEDLVKP
jgi:C_GCAxxG_C_C family probable redox protein